MTVTVPNVLAQISTLFVQYNVESTFRDRTKLNLTIQKERQRVAAILGMCLPQRLLTGALHVPLIEAFEDVTILFCR